MYYRLYPDTFIESEKLKSVQPADEISIECREHKAESTLYPSPLSVSCICTPSNFLVELAISQSLWSSRASTVKVRSRSMRIRVHTYIGDHRLCEIANSTRKVDGVRIPATDRGTGIVRILPKEGRLTD